jgi:hypothetical protein
MGGSLGWVGGTIFEHKFAGQWKDRNENKNDQQRLLLTKHIKRNSSATKRQKLWRPYVAERTSTRNIYKPEAQSPCGYPTGPNSNDVGYITSEPTGIQMTQADAT